jgi:hypothetical protein
MKMQTTEQNRDPLRVAAIDRQVVIFRFPRLAASENALISPGQKEDDCLTINKQASKRLHSISAF